MVKSAKEAILNDLALFLMRFGGAGLILLTVCALGIWVYYLSSLRPAPRRREIRREGVWIAFWAILILVTAGGMIYASFA